MISSKPSLTREMERYVAETLATLAMRRGEHIRAACHLLCYALPEARVNDVLLQLTNIAAEEAARNAQTHRS